MNSKIPVSNLAQKIASASQTDSDKALKFIKDLFAVIESEVAKGENVTISGLGTFAKSHSLNEPITFTPDTDFADELNEAFALFTPTELNPEVSEDELMAITVDLPETKSKNNETDEQEDVQISMESDEKDVDVSDLTAASSEVNIETSQNESSDDNENKADEIEIATATDLSQSATIDEIEQPTAVDDNNDADTVQNVELQSESEVVNDTENSTNSPIEIKLEDSTEQGDNSNQELEDTAEAHQLFEDEETVIVKRRSSHLWLGITIGFILGFAAGVVAFLAYIVSYLKIPVESFILY